MKKEHARRKPDLPSIRRTYSRRVPDICPMYARRMPSICFAKVRSLLSGHIPTCAQHCNHVAGIYPDLSQWQMCGIGRTCAGPSQAFAWHKPGLCQTYAWHVRGIRTAFASSGRHTMTSVCQRLAYATQTPRTCHDMPGVCFACAKKIRSIRHRNGRLIQDPR